MPQSQTDLQQDDSQKQMDQTAFEKSTTVGDGGSVPGHGNLNNMSTITFSDFDPLNYDMSPNILVQDFNLNLSKIIQTINQQDQVKEYKEFGQQLSQGEEAM